MTGISDLPPELIIRIMRLCNTPYDLLALIQASPLFFHIFLLNRPQLMKPIIEDLETRFGGPVPRMCHLAALLRYVHSKRPDTASTQDLEYELEFSRSSCFELPEAGIQLHPTHRISLLCSLSTLLEEAERVMHRYMPRAWEEEVCDWSPYWTWVWQRQPTIHDKQTLSQDEKQKFFHSAFCVESFCQLYFSRTETLFKREPILPQFFTEAHADETTPLKHNAFNSICHYICLEYWDLMHEVIMEGMCMPTDRSGSFQVEESCATGAPHQQRLYFDHFRRRTPNERAKFIHFLFSQGLAMLLKINSMGSKNRIVFILRSFYDFMVAHEIAPGSQGSNYFYTDKHYYASPRLWHYVDCPAAIRGNHCEPPVFFGDHCNVSGE
ncbi:hypothetical protein FSARC_7970 [Fusarium sarcochroum]|uniref:F-box domain-containing protein n=1 Tax=Fusarium sarcochroum TaxID=1208366 RepID=A0A8H4X6U1_9HYPO|nr:hypothetical protein FSARC_7970 [Fusarium sarcochroum]